MSYLRRHKRGWAWLAILVLVAHAMALAASTPDPRADSVLGPFVICTSNGAKAAPGGGSSDGPPPCDHCLACTTFAQFGLAAVIDPGAIAFAAMPTLRPVPTGARSLAIHLAFGGIRSRGPPHPAA